MLADKIFKFLLGFAYTILLLFILFLTTALFAAIEYSMGFYAKYTGIIVVIIILYLMVYAKAMFYLVIIEKELRRIYKTL